jgi:pyruvate ferredoxin oxidoreductase alpha subunit
LYLIGSAYHTAKVAAQALRREGKKVGVITTRVLRPYPGEALYALCKNAKVVVVADRQDSYGAGGGNLSLELRAALQQYGENGPVPRVISRVYGLGGKAFYEEDAKALFALGEEKEAKAFDYVGVSPGTPNAALPVYFPPLTQEETRINPGENPGVKQFCAMPKRLAPGHGACPGCGIPVNVNLLLAGIPGNVVLLFQTGCGMVVTTPYPKTAFRIPYVHNLFQNGAATLSGVAAMFRERQRRGEYPEGEITFVMVSGDGGMDIGMGSALGSALRGEPLILFEYDNGGYMNTGYQLSYSTPKGAKSATSHVGVCQYGKSFFHKDMPMLMAATGMPYVATVAESDPVDFMRKAEKAKQYANAGKTAYIKALSACPLNWNDQPNTERRVIAAAVDCCYHPLYEVEEGITKLSRNPETEGKKIPVLDWLAQMGRTRHLTKPEYRSVVEEIQTEVDRRWERLKARAEHPIL